LEIPSLGRYQIRGRIGCGTMGIVYRGYDPVLAREIALKTVDLSPAPVGVGHMEERQGPGSPRHGGPIQGRHAGDAPRLAPEPSL